MPQKTSSITPNSFIIPLTLFILCIVIYANSIFHPFLLDDLTIILPSSLSDLNFLQLTSNGGNAVYFRPITHFLCALNHHLFGSSTFGYHFINIIIFYLIGLGFYHLIYRLFKNLTLSLISTVLFVIHPINGVLVNYKIATGYGLMMFCAISSLFIHSKENLKARDYLLSVILFFVGMLCHEIMIAFPFYLTTMLLIIQKKSFKETFHTISGHILVLIIYWCWRLSYLKIQTDISHNLRSLNLSFLDLPAFWMKALSWYLWQMLSPTQIVLVKDIELTAAEMIFWNLAAFASTITLIVFFILFKKNKPILLGLTWFLINLLLFLVASISRPEMGVIIQPHWLTFGSLGLFLCLASFLSTIKYKINIYLWMTILTSTFLIYMTSAFEHNNHWQSQKEYCLYWLTFSPNNFWANYSLGTIYLQEGKLLLAKQYLRRAVKEGKANYQVWENLGIVENHLGNKKDARIYFEAVLRQAPDDSIAKDFLRQYAQ